MNMSAHRCYVTCATFDVTGTLLQPRESPGEAYLRCLESFCSPQFENRNDILKKLDHGFGRAFNLHTKEQPNFGVDADGIVTWWETIVHRTFKEAEVQLPPEYTAQLCDVLFKYYEDPVAWKVGNILFNPPLILICGYLVVP